MLAGGQPEGDNARRLARFGLAGLVSARPAWQVAVKEAPELSGAQRSSRLMLTEIRVRS